MHRVPATVAALAAVATLGMSAGSAFAAGSPSTAPSGAATPAGKAAPAKAPATLQQIQAQAAADIATRVGDLNAAVAKVQAARDLGGDQATLVARLQADVTGLGQLGQKIAADTTPASARADRALIFTNYRIIALALPVARLVGAVDRIDNATLPKLTAFEAKVTARLTPANSAQVQPLLSDIAAQVAAAGKATSGVSATLLAFTPTQWNADHHLLDAERASVKSAVADLAKAASDRKQILALAGRSHRAPAAPAAG